MSTIDIIKNIIGYAGLFLALYWFFRYVAPDLETKSVNPRRCEHCDEKDDG